MRHFLEKFDTFAGLEAGSPIERWLARTAFFFLLVMAASAPNSIAATQIAWGIGMLASIAGLVIYRRAKFRFGWMDAALWAYFLWSVISGAFSYEPAVSLDKLRSVSLFLIFYFVRWTVKTQKAATLAAFLMIASCMVNLIMTPIERVIGRGVEIHGLRTDGPLGKALLWENDTLLAADGKKLHTPEDLAAALSAKDVVRLNVYRIDYEFIVNVRAADELAGATAAEKLGFASWTRSHSWRSEGFYSHFTTYAEMLQLMAALIFAMLLIAYVRKKDYLAWRPKGALLSDRVVRFIASRTFLFAAFALACLALLLTVTRASQLGLMIAAFVIVILSASRRAVVTTILIAIPVVLIGLVFLQQVRHVSFFDPHDDSTKYREMMWRDGGRLLVENPRHLLVGVGMDSVQKHWQEWGMYDNGWQPMGHFHSVPVQLAVERGIPALLFWLLFIGLLAHRLLKGLRRADALEPYAHGILLGACGCLAGFFTSGLVHWNLGDAEVAMVFFIIMGLAAALTAIPTGELLPDAARIDNLADTH